MKNEKILSLNKLSRERFFKSIEKYQDIYILRHTNPDGDALGSQFGLKKLLKHHFPNKNIYTVGNDISSYFAKYFPKSDLDILPKNLNDCLIISVDTANFDRLNFKDFDLKKNYLISLDHHPKKNTFANFEILEPNYSSASELIIDLFKNKDITKKAALFLYIGLITDTNRFKYDNVTDNTFQAASKIIQKVNSSSINDYFDSLNLENLLNLKKTIKFIKIVDKNKLILVIPKWYSLFSKWKNGAPKSLLFEIQRLYEIDYILFSSYDFEQKKWKGSIRSKLLPINNLAEKYDGGGHEKAAGFSLKNSKELKNIKKDFILLGKENEK